MPTRYSATLSTRLALLPLELAPFCKSVSPEYLIVVFVPVTKETSLALKVSQLNLLGIVSKKGKRVSLMCNAISYATIVRKDIFVEQDARETVK